MGRGKNESTSQSAYSTEKNEVVNNRVFVSDQTAQPTGDQKRHTVEYYTKYFMNTDGLAKVTRDPFRMLDSNRAKKYFGDLVERYEMAYEVQLADLSKRELMFKLLEMVEQAQAMVALKDDARQFMTYRFVVPDILKLYLYKVFYPRIFDFSKSDEGITFSSTYIQQNFSIIYRQIEVLSYTLIYDAMIMAAADVCENEILSIKKDETALNCGEDAEGLYEHLTGELGRDAQREPRFGILALLVPSLLFKAKHYGYVYGFKTETAKKTTRILSVPVFYKGNRATESRRALLKAWQDTKTFLEECPENFSFLLNAYFLNRKTHLYDFRILQTNREFKAYLLDGIVSKHFMDDMIQENSALIPEVNPEGLLLSSVHNNPNSIADNLSTRDYEVLDFIMTRLAKCFVNYYFRSDDKGVSPSALMEVIRWLNQESGAERMRELVPSMEIEEVHPSDYAEVLGPELV